MHTPLGVLFLNANFLHHKGANGFSKTSTHSWCDDVGLGLILQAGLTNYPSFCSFHPAFTSDKHSNSHAHKMELPPQCAHTCLSQCKVRSKCVRRMQD